MNLLLLKENMINTINPGSTIFRCICPIILLFSIGAVDMLAQPKPKAAKSNFVVVNHLSAYPAVTWETGRNMVGTSIGVSWEFQAMKELGFGFSGLAIFSDGFELLAEIPVYYHIDNRFVFWGGPGVAYTNKVSYSRFAPTTDTLGNPIAIPPDKPNKGNFMLLAGFGWNIPYQSEKSGTSFMPYISSYFINTDVIYLGLGFKVIFQFYNKQ